MPTSSRVRQTKHLTGSLFLLEGRVLEEERNGTTRASLQARKALGVAHFEADRFDAAVAVLEPVVNDCLSLFGDADPDTVVALGNLGMTYMYLERSEQGLALLNENVAHRERNFGAADPLTMTARHAQAIAYQMAGRLSDALATFASVARQRSHILGPAHPDSLTSRVALALARADSGDTVGAVPGLMSALEDAEHSVGPRTVPALTIRIHLADCHAELGNINDAAAGLRRAAADYQAVLGPTAPLAMGPAERGVRIATGGRCRRIRRGPVPECIRPDYSLSPRALPDLAGKLVLTRSMPVLITSRFTRTTPTRSPRSCWPSKNGLLRRER